MPHRVEKAVRQIDSLRRGVKEGQVLKRSVVDLALEGDREGLIQAILDQMKTFQMTFDDEVIEATKAGTLLAEELLGVSQGVER
ncbi:hypothetical protein LCGC14_1338230 [marine sediment metagenome]|uniref:Uncharacterized protein n=1 Tax=marine sediment metagenome TaxID=412755 RepID=A0A0F9MVD0_9ZZZZ